VKNEEVFLLIKTQVLVLKKDQETSKIMIKSQLSSATDDNVINWDMDEFNKVSNEAH
jgi:hypothetical protein